MFEVLHLLPAASATAAENLAVDWLMLENFTEAEAVRLRFYEWSRPSFTFGYGQKWADIRAACPPGVDVIRRPTGGGLVDHRADWTFALVLPAAHPLAKIKACESYRLVHEALAEALNQRGASCQLQAAGCKSGGKTLAICFEKAETHDVVRTDNGGKIAGAAQKRGRQGLLIQGSVSRKAAKEIKNWTDLPEIFTDRLCRALNAKMEAGMKATWTNEVLRQAVVRFSSREWNERR